MKLIKIVNTAERFSLAFEFTDLCFRKGVFRKRLFVNHQIYFVLNASPYVIVSLREIIYKSVKYPLIVFVCISMLMFVGCISYINNMYR